MSTTDYVQPLFNWIPYKLIEKNGTVFFEWIYLGEKRFTDPFFDDTIARCKSHPVNSSPYKVITTADNLVQWAEQIISVPLSGLIFHVSRCGSTMISQLLAVPCSNIVISEAPVIDQVLRNKCLEMILKKKLISALLTFFGQKRFNEEKHLMLKLDAWHLLEIEQLRFFLPDLPFFILYRNPADVLKSHIHLRGMHMVPKMLPLNIFGLDDKKIEAFSLNQFGVTVLEKYYEAILIRAPIDENILLADYQEGMEKIIESLNIFLNIPVTKKSHHGIQERLKAHSKYPGSAFTDDKDVLLNIDLTIVNDLYRQITVCSLRV